MRLHRLTALAVACALLAGCIGSRQLPLAEPPSGIGQHRPVLAARGIGVPACLHPRQLRTGPVR